MDTSIVDPLEWSQNNQGDRFVCKCNNFSTSRIDNFKIHVKEKHQKIKKMCECGKQMTTSSLSRHKKNHCPLTKQPMKPEPVTTITEAPQTSSRILEMHAETPPESPVEQESMLTITPMFEIPTSATHVEEHEVKINVKIETQPDGNIIITHDDISIAGVLFTLQLAP